jgi:hypothetical protein
MSALTPKKMREIEAQYREMMAKRASKVFLTITCDVRTIEDTFVIPSRIMNSILEMKGVESASYTDSPNVISVIAQWRDFEVNDRVEDIRTITGVLHVKVQTLSPRF